MREDGSNERGPQRGRPATSPTPRGHGPTGGGFTWAWLRTPVGHAGGLGLREAPPCRKVTAPPTDPSRNGSEGGSVRASRSCPEPVPPRRRPGVPVRTHARGPTETADHDAAGTPPSCRPPREHGPEGTALPAATPPPSTCRRMRGQVTRGVATRDATAPPSKRAAAPMPPTCGPDGHPIAPITAALRVNVPSATYDRRTRTAALVAALYLITYTGGYTGADPMLVATL